MKENPFKDFVVGDYSDNNYEKIDLLKTLLIRLSSSNE